MLISLLELPENLRKHVSTLSACVKLALADFVADQSAHRVRYSARTEASIIHDYMVWYAKDMFPWKLRRNLFLLHVENDYRVKLKKLDGRWRPRNIQTDLVLQFEEQRPLRLFDDLDLTHLFLGYQRDEAEILRSSIWLVRPNGRTIQWAAELGIEDGASAMNFAVIAPTDPTRDADIRRVRPKIAAQGATKSGHSE